MTDTQEKPPVNIATGKPCVWVVGQNMEPESLAPRWELQGVFTTEQKALDACKGHPTYFLGPVPLDHALPHETGQWPDAYYPNV